MRVIGLVGRVGAGKSTVAAEFERLGCARFDADDEARGLLGDPLVAEAIRARWGDAVFDATGVNRQALAAIVFVDPMQRRDLESIIHPRVRKRMHEAIDIARAGGSPAIVLDIPLLVEGGLDEICDVVVFVDAPIERCEEFVRVRGWDEAERSRREQSQAPIDRKRDAAGFGIVNDGSLSDLHERVAATLDAILHEKSTGNPAT
jgi:dephospho-CoA kinase